MDDKSQTVLEAPLQQTAAGLVPAGDGWFVANARDARWWYGEGRSAICDFEAESDVRQLGINVTVLDPGVPMTMYHWEADQEDFLVVSGEALAIVEGEERPLRQWDFFHCPPGTTHTIVGAGDRPCVVVAVGARAHQGKPGWGAYAVDRAALRHRAGVEHETTNAREAYAGLIPREPTCYREGWLPE